MKVLLDTNIILDFYCNREDFYEEAACIFDKACNGEIDIYISPISFVNFFYITRKEYTVIQRYEILNGLLEICHITPADESVIRKALSMHAPDFEDMVQLQSAVFASADCIVTRNTKDFNNNDIPVYTPSAFLSKMD